MSGDDHPAKRPSWLCANCGDPWPCDRARDQLAAEMNPSALAVMMSVDMVDAACEHPTIKPSELFERFLAWTR